MECWSIGILKYWVFKSIIPLFHHSSIPAFSENKLLRGGLLQLWVEMV